MPITLKLTFPGGRYHATPWGRHVNEGVAEWPPSPWRLLRALVATWKRKYPDLSEEQVRRVLVQLLPAPKFHLPTARVAHTRHYMPWEKKGPDDRTLVFDTFVAVGRSDPLFVHWGEANLADDDRAALARLADNLTALGRAEGWVHAELTTETADWNCAPAAISGPGEELVPVFCPDPATALGDEYYPPSPDAKALKKGLKPGDFLFDCPRWHLCLDTETIHDARWPRVPGSVWVSYARPADAFTTRAPASPRPSPPPEARPTVARFLLDGPVLPAVTETVRVAEVFRSAAMRRFGDWCRDHRGEGEPFRRTDRLNEFSSPTLSGKQLSGEMRQDHDHAHYLPTADGGDGRRITHITVYAAEGFGPVEVAALTAVRELRLAGGSDRITILRAQLMGLGPTGLFRSSVPMFSASSSWLSATPFVAHRHPKRRGTKRDAPHLTGPDGPISFAELALRELVARRGVGELVTVALDTRVTGVRATEFGRARSRPGDDGRARPHGGFRITFAGPIPGPLCLGYACHYGLGLFVPEPAARES